MGQTAQKSTQDGAPGHMLMSAIPDGIGDKAMKRVHDRKKLRNRAKREAAKAEAKESPRPQDPAAETYLAECKKDKEDREAKAKEKALKAKSEEKALKAKAKEEALEAKAKEKALKAKAKKETLEAKAKEKALKAKVKKEALEAKAKEKALKATAKREALTAKVIKRRKYKKARRARDKARQDAETQGNSNASATKDHARVPTPALPPGERKCSKCGVSFDSRRPRGCEENKCHHGTTTFVFMSNGPLRHGKEETEQEVKELWTCCRKEGKEATGCQMGNHVAA